MEETVLFKMDVSEESIKREAMKVVWTFPGVTFVDIEEKGILKVKGIFDKNRMGRKLQIIDKSVDFINPSQKADQKSYLSYLFTPKQKEMIIFEFKVLNEVIKAEVMKVIWECSGVTSVEVEKGCNIEVKGREFDNLEMVMKVKEIDENVKTILDCGVGSDVIAEPDSTNSSLMNVLNMGKVVGIGGAVVEAGKALHKKVVDGMNNHQQAQTKQQKQKKLASGPQRYQVPVPGFIKDAAAWWRKPSQKELQERQKNFCRKPNKEEIERWQRDMPP